jgi:shikimate dehydrogenase
VNEVLELGLDGWLRDGRPWQSKQPFYAVLGDPVAHSLSPVMQNAALLDRGVDTEYLAARVTAGLLRSLKTGPAGEMLAGFNATAPLKEAVAALCDGRTDPARDLGAVNTVRVEDGKWMGHNTDSGGVLTVMSSAWTGAALPERAVVLGAGGSARAAVDAMIRWEVPHIEVRNRSAAGRERIATWLKGRGLADRVAISELISEPEGPTTTSVWVCCLAGKVDAIPYLPVAAGPDPAFLLDLRYGDQLPDNPAPLGFDFNDGLPVLLMQGGLSFAWWFGPPVPWVAMKDALS